MQSVIYIGAKEAFQGSSAMLYMCSHVWICMCVSQETLGDKVKYNSEVQALRLFDFQIAMYFHAFPRKQSFLKLYQ